MSRLRSHLSPRVVLALLVMVLGTSLIVLAAPARHRRPAGDSTWSQRASVRTSREASLLPLKSSCTVNPTKELFITDVSVVDDCIRTTWGPCAPSPFLPATQGAWTFGAQMMAVAGTNNAVTLSNFTINWLKQWSVNQTLNGDLVPARPAVQQLIINPWLAASGGAILDMKKAPFRLLAIVARLDLRQSPTSAGEGRFIYDLLDPNGNPTQFLVIFEYHLDTTDCNGVLNWAHLWHGLGAHPFGPDYNAALESVTNLFATIGAAPARLNGSAISQVRTNDFHLAHPWELREFHLAAGGAPAPLLESTVAQTPARSLQQTPNIASYVNANTPAILANSYTVPLNWAGTPFLGGAAPHNLDLGWDGPPPVCTSILNLNARANFSLNTCSGCHGQETGTAFKQVEPRAAGVPSVLAGFLTGTAVVDMCGINHTFSDINRRSVDLCNLLSETCTTLNSEPPVTFVH